MFRVSKCAMYTFRNSKSAIFIIKLACTSLEEEPLHNQYGDVPLPTICWYTWSCTLSETMVVNACVRLLRV